MTINKGKRSALSIIFFTVFLDLVGVGIAIPIFAPLLLNADGMLPGSTLAEKELILGVVIGLFPLAQFIGAPILGTLSDRWGRKKLLALSIVGGGIGYALSAAGIEQGSIELVLISRVIAGFMGGNLSIAMSSIADISKNEEKAKNFGLIGMAFGLGFIIGPYIGGKLSDPTLVSWFDYSTPMWASAALALLNALLVCVNLPETLKAKTRSRINPLVGFSNMYKAFTMPSLRALFVVIFLINLGFNFFTQFFQVFLIGKFAYTQSQIGDFFAYMGFWLAVTQGFILGPVSRRYPPEKALRVFILLSAVMLPLLLIPSEATYIYLIIPFIAVSQGITRPNYTAEVSNLSKKDVQGEILGINQSVQSLSMAIPPFISGLIVAVDLSLPIVAATVLTFAGWVVYVLFFNPRVKKLFGI